MKQGTQIAYVPPHAKGDLYHISVQFGFVIREAHCGDRDAHLCRYWLRGYEGIQLRTTANSELTPTTHLVEHQSVGQSVVDSWLVELGYAVSHA
jgi:hypothetical protein